METNRSSRADVDVLARHLGSETAAARVVLPSWKWRRAIGELTLGLHANGAAGERARLAAAQEAKRLPGRVTAASTQRGWRQKIAYTFALGTAGQIYLTHS